MTAFTSRTSNCLYAAIDPGKSSAIRSVSAPGKRSLDRGRRRLDPLPLLDVLRDRLTGGVEQGEHADLAAQVGTALEQQAERLEAARHVLRRVGAIDAQDQPLRARGFQLPLAGQHGLAERERLELGRIDRDRVRGDVPLVELEPETGAGVEERAPPALRVETRDVAGEQPLVNGTHDALRQHRPVARADPGNVREVGERDLGVPLAHERGRDVEVVVVEEDRGLRLALELLDDRVGEVAVDRDVAVVPGRAEILPGVVLALPEPVLDEPEHRVRDHVVVEVVGDGRMRDEPEPVARAVAERSRRPCPPPRRRGPRSRSRSRSR